ncbi:MAG TPA: hypothetical protein VM582_08160 [Candidatus Thermoplasmatota archaeon]|nr:hypothetical protein [Candidatus Thermoplasmatota archaeon]
MRLAPLADALLVALALAHPAQAAHEVLDVLRDRATLAALEQHERFHALVAEVAARRMDPYAAADRLTGT